MDKKAVLITDMDLRGRGIGKVDGKAVFIPDTVIGDTVEYTVSVSKKRYDIGKLTKILSSTHRVTPLCAGSSRCGGCAFMNLSRDDELSIKRRAVEAAFRRSGIKDITVSKFISTNSLGYRNKAIFHLGDNKKYGFYNLGSNELYHPDHCVIIPDIFNEIINETESILENDPTIVAPKSIMLRSAGDDIMITAEVSGMGESATLFSILIGKFPCIVSAYENTGYPTDSKTKFRCIYGEKSIITKFGDISLAISPKSFFQINSEIAMLFCKEISSYLSPNNSDLILDLYCGIGTIGLTLAKAFPEAIITGIEINESAVLDARKNCRLSDITNADFICNDAGHMDYRELSPYAMVVDPPRFGLSDSMIKSIIDISPRILCYMSCDPGTLAGNALKLISGGYKIKECIAGDMFPYSPHVETLCFFEKNG